jgi:putative SOS response-associated peptidase YedK
MATLFKEVSYNLATLIQQINMGIIWLALPNDWEQMDYKDFLVERRKRMAQVRMHMKPFVHSRCIPTGFAKASTGLSQTSSEFNLKVGNGKYFIINKFYTTKKKIR